MHPRNPYGTPPNFDDLAHVFPALKPFVVRDAEDRPALDFKNAAAQRALTCAFLFRDFGLDVHLPEDRLIPPVPNRLNYVLWIQDLVHACSLADSPPASHIDQGIVGVDVGTGASAIYPLLATALQRTWRMFATDIDEESLHHARQNVERNDLSTRIAIVQARKEGHVLFPIHENPDTHFTFTMCNPPFYESHAAMKRSAATKAAPPQAVLTASKNELVVAGGEVGFVRRMIQESLILQGRCRWYTSMVGHMSSLTALVEYLTKESVENYAITELVQGQTRRWVLGWSFDEIRLPDSIARASSTALQALLPPRNSIVQPMPMPVTTTLQQRSSHQLNETLQTALRQVHRLDVRKINLSISNGKLRQDQEFNYPYTESETKHVPPIRPPAPSTGFLVAASANTWSRAARRKAQMTMDTDTDALEPAQSSSVAPLLVCRAFWVPSDNSHNDSAIDTIESGIHEAVLQVDWVRGRDRGLFESFAGHVARKVWTVLDQQFQQPSHAH